MAQFEEVFSIEAERVKEDPPKELTLTDQVSPVRIGDWKVTDETGVTVYMSDESFRSLSFRPLNPEAEAELAFNP